MVNEREENLSRICLLTLFSSAAVWLVVGSIFSLIASTKFHSPGFLADPAWLTYGRVRAAASNMFLYGFCLPGGLGVALWVLTRVGRSAVVFPAGVILGAILLNVGAALTLGGILFGDLTGFEPMEVPGYAGIFLFLGYLLAGASAALTLHVRSHAGLRVPEWFILAGIFWFPWIFSTAQLLLVDFPVRGVAQSVISWWYAGNFQLVWLGLIGLGAVFYILPRFAGSEFNSRYLALFAFWILVLFGSWTGIPQSAPVPAWMPVLSTVATVLSSLFFIAVLLTIWRTSAERCRELWRGLPAYASFGVSAFLLAGFIGVLLVVSGKSETLNFTWAGAGQWQFAVYGFFAMVVFGCSYTTLAEYAGRDGELPRFARLQFWLAAIGTILVAVPLIGAGLLQSAKIRNPDVAFVDISRATLHFLRISTMGDLLILAANALFLFSLVSFIVSSTRARARTALAAVTAEVPR